MKNSFITSGPNLFYNELNVTDKFGLSYLIGYKTRVNPSKITTNM